MVFYSAPSCWGNTKTTSAPANIKIITITSRTSISVKPPRFILRCFINIIFYCFKWTDTIRPQFKFLSAGSRISLVNSDLALSKRACHRKYGQQQAKRKEADSRRHKAKNERFHQAHRLVHFPIGPTLNRIRNLQQHFFELV